MSNWWERHITPRLIRCCCAQPQIMKARSHVVPLASGRVFELGCGGGLNQRHYDKARVTSFAGIDPSEALLEGARARAREQGWQADIRQGVGEAIPFPVASFDTVVVTYTLCSVQNPALVMQELARILKPGGRMLFLEHGRAPDAAPARWQRRIEPVWKRLMGNCHLTREISAALTDAGFAVDTSGQEYHGTMPRWASWMEWGTARKLA